MKTLRIVNYAVNGGGVGHLTRLLAISRWLRRYAAHAGVRAEIYFLTSSEADGLALPRALRLVQAAVEDDRRATPASTSIAYLALAKQWVWHSLGLLRPDLLIVDTFPRGSFGELLSALDLCRHRAFVYRPVKDELRARADFQAMLPLYDAILVPGDEDDAPVRRAADGARAGCVHVGPVLSRERGELLPRDEARARLGVARRTARGVRLRGRRRRRRRRGRSSRAVHAALAASRTCTSSSGPGPLYRGRPSPARA